MPSGIAKVKPPGIAPVPTLSLVAEPSTPAQRLRALCDLLFERLGNESEVGRLLGISQPQTNKIRRGDRSGTSSGTLEAVISKTSLDPRFFFDPNARVEDWEKWRRSRARLRAVTPPNWPAAPSLDGFNAFVDTLAKAFNPRPTSVELEWLRSMPYGGMAGDYANALTIARRSAPSTLSDTGEHIRGA